MARAHIVDPNDEGSLEPGADQGASRTEAPLDTRAEDQLLGDDVPEKYRGKGSRDLLGVVTHQESMIGRQSQEVAALRDEARRLREMVDKTILSRMPGGEEPAARKPLTKEEFWDNPQETVPRVMNDALSERDNRLARLEYDQRRNQFNSTYKSAAADINDPAFVAYVEKSQRRQRLAQRAFKDLERIDFDAAEELWESWSEYQELKAEAAPAPNASGDPKPNDPPVRRKQTPPPAMRGSGGGDPDQNTNTPTGKIWTETELNAMQEKDPDAYWAMAAAGEIDRAWREKRVKRTG